MDISISPNSRSKFMMYHSEFISFCEAFSKGCARVSKFYPSYWLLWRWSNLTYHKALSGVCKTLPNSPSRLVTPQNLTDITHQLLVVIEMPYGIIALAAHLRLSTREKTSTVRDWSSFVTRRERSGSSYIRAAALSSRNRHAHFTRMRSLRGHFGWQKRAGGKTVCRIIPNPT